MDPSGKTFSSPKELVPVPWGKSCSTGKWRWSIKLGGGSFHMFGVCTTQVKQYFDKSALQARQCWVVYAQSPKLYSEGSGAWWGSCRDPYTSGTTVGLELDCEAGTLSLTDPTDIAGTGPVKLAYANLPKNTPLFPVAAASGDGATMTMAVDPSPASAVVLEEKAPEPEPPAPAVQYSGREPEPACEPERLICFNCEEEVDALCGGCCRYCR